MKAKLLAGAFVLFGTLLSGCAARGGYYAQYGPPAPRYRVIGVAPGPGYIWTNGYWNLRGRNWSWVDGRWQRPPRRGAVWVAPRWNNDHGRWRFHRGGWR